MNTPLRPASSMTRALNVALTFTVLGWTVVCAGSITYHYLDAERHIKEIARYSAAENIDKDMLYRAWAAGHGGVYVPATEKTPPSPFLKQFKERDVITPSGRRLTLVNPAYMTRQVHELGVARGSIRGHISSGKPIRPEDRADAWELKALEAIADGQKDFGGIVMLDGSLHYRLLRPLFIEESCLPCHAAQGYKLGDLRGGISASVPMDAFVNIAHDHLTSEARHFGTVWLLGIAGIFAAAPYLQRRARQQEEMTKKLSESETRYRTIVDTSLEGIVVIDGRAVISFSNARMADMLGYAREELNGLSIFAIMPDDERADHEYQLELRQQGIATQYERRFLRKDGTVILTRASASPLMDEQGVYRGAFGMFADITGHKRMEEAIRASEAKYRLLTESVRAISWEFDLRENRWTYVAPQAEEVLGYAPDEWRDLEWWAERIPEAWRERSVDSCAEAARKGKDHAFEYPFVRRDGCVIWLHDLVNVEMKDGAPVRMRGVMVDVTERRRAEDALQAAKEYAENLIQTANTIVVGLDVGGNVTVFNQAAESITGYRFSELQGRNWFETVVPKDRYPQVWAQFEQLTAAGILRNFENPILTKSGEERYIVWQNNEVYANGKIVGTISFGMDSTERRRTEVSLKESEERHRNLIDQSPDAIYVHRDDRIVFANAMGARLMGARTPEDLYDRPFFEFVPPRLHDALREQMHCLKADGSPAPLLEAVFIRLDKSSVEVEIAAIPISHGGGHAVQVVARDVSKRKEIERMLKKADAQYRVIVDTALEGIIVNDGNGMITLVNPQLLEMLGYAHEEMLGRYIIDFVDERERQEHEKHLELQKRGLVSQYERRFLRKDGSVIWTHASSAPLIDEQGAFYGGFGMFTDITSQRRAEEQRKKLEEQLLQSQKIESVGRLAGGIAHDINNMLTPILGYAELLELKIPDEDPRREDLKEIADAAERIRDMTRQLLAFARKQTLEMSRLDINTVVTGFSRMLTRTLRENIEIKLQLAPSVGFIQGDTHQLEQVLLNLAVNAQDAMPSGGILTLATRSVAADEAYTAARPGMAPGNYVQLQAIDTGSGMDQHVRERLFEPFFTTKEAGRGTGLGLATVYGIVKQHGGYIEVASEPGMGTAFLICLPVDDKTVAGNARESQTPVTRTGTETVLVVEDHAQVLQLVSQVLSGYGYQVLAATSGREALETAQSFPGEIQLVVSDVIMPGMNGKELFERISEARKGIRILYMSGYPAEVLSPHGVLDSGISFIRKPFNVLEFTAKVRQVLEA